MQYIKDCPFCGENEEKIEADFFTSGKWACYCPTCGSRGPLKDTAEEAREEWCERI
jgi:Lar family restriction alleviation protein